MFGLPYVSDAFMACTDPDCHTINDASCDNYNYLSSYALSSWTLTGVSESTSKVYYKLQLDSNFVYDSGAKLVVYLNDQTEYLTINLTADDLEKAASSGYLGSFSIPNEYKTKNSSIKIKLENTSYNGTAVDTNLTAKIVNY